MRNRRFLQELEDNCPRCAGQRSREVKLHAESRNGATVYIVCSACDFEMTDHEYGRR